MKTNASQLKPGDRIVCVRNVTETHLYIFGRGVYIGQTETPDGPDVKIKLDDGQEMYGRESPIWLFEHDLNDPEVSALTIEVVSIANDRAMRQKIHAVCARIGKQIASAVPGMFTDTVAMVRSGPHSATLRATFIYERPMTSEEIAEIDALTIDRMNTKRRPS